MFLTIAHLPDASVRELPVLADPLEASAHLHPNVVRGGTYVLVRQVKRVHEFAVDVSLELRNSCVSDAHGSGRSIPFPVIQRMLGKFVVACDREDHRPRGVWMGVLRRV